MIRSRFRAFATAAILCIAGALPAADEGLAREVVAKRAKGATALVEVRSNVGGQGFGTAFCVHASGLFVTNEHVVRRGGDAVTLVLNAGMPTQKVLKAKVLRRDKTLDLALLQVDAAGPEKKSPKGVDDAWVDEVKKMSAEEQVRA